MADIEGSTYYILRGGFQNPDSYELTKWDPLRPKRPRELYVMNLPHRGASFNYCSCPSPKRPCKHYDIAKALLTATTDKVLLPQLIWQESKVSVASDIRFGP